MIRRASAGRRRLNSADSVHESTPDKQYRSRSQERSVSVRDSIAPQFQFDEAIHSQASSTTGSDLGDMLEDLDPLELRKPISLGGGVVSENGMVLTGSKKDKIPPNSAKYHRRSVSDPFDVSGLDETETATESTSGESAPQALPTLPRYPVAETRDLNCWSEPKVDIFKVRGKNYLKDKKKVASEPYLFRARGCDLLLFPKEGEGSTVNIFDRSDVLLNGTLHKAPTLVLNFRFPWGVMLLHFEFPETMKPFLHKVPKEQHHSSHKDVPNGLKLPSLDSLSPGERTLAQWIMGDTKYKNQRLKLIPYVVQGPWVVRNLVTGKPAIIGTKLPVSYQVSNDLLVAELDIGNSSATAKRIVSLCRRYMNALTCDIGFVIQGNTAEELPEQMLGSIRIHGVDPLKAPTIS